MKLYVISQNVSNGYDTYDSAVVAAKSEQEAARIYPGYGWENYRYDENKRMWYTRNSNGTRYYRDYAGDWALSADQVQVEYIGEAAEGTKAGQILSSFNAG